MVVAFDFANDFVPVLKLMQKYVNVPMSLADACLVRMTEMRSDAVILTTDTDFLYLPAPRPPGYSVRVAMLIGGQLGVKFSQSSQRLAHGVGSQAITRAR